MWPRAQRAVGEQVRMPPGYHVEWSGQFEYLQRAKARMTIVVPVTLLVIFVLLYLNFGRLTETLIVMLSVPFALVGGVWLMYLAWGSTSAWRSRSGSSRSPAWPPKPASSC